MHEYSCFDYIASHVNLEKENKVKKKKNIWLVKFQENI